MASTQAESSRHEAIIQEQEAEIQRLRHALQSATVALSDVERYASMPTNALRRAAMESTEPQAHVEQCRQATAAQLQGLQEKRASQEA